MAADVHKMYDESDGMKKRAENTAERLNNVETQFKEDQKSIDEVNSIIVFYHFTIF